MEDFYGEGDFSFPSSEELNVSRGSAAVTTGEEEATTTINIDTPEGAAIAIDYWSLTGMAAPSKPGGPPYENILDQFATYSPLWTFAAITPDQYNNPYLYRDNRASLDNIIFSSAGRYDSQRTQTVVGAPEYFVNNFEMKMTTAATEKTGVTNNISMTFDVYEPYSMGYFVQSVQTAALNAGYPNYIGTPFVLILDFVGHKDNGQMFSASKLLTKYFVIQFKKVTFSTNEGGTNYKVEAAPYNHTGFTNVAQQITKDIKIRGENIKEMLVSGNMSLCKVLNEAQKELVPKKQLTADEYVIVFPKNWSDKVGLPGEGEIPDEAVQATVDPDEPASSPLVGRQGQQTLTFGLGEIGSASLGFGPSSGGNLAFGFEGDVVDEATGLITRNSLKIDPKQREFQFPQGSTVQNVITQIILSSDYAKNALDPSKLDDAGRIKWFRIDVQIKIGEFDVKRAARQRTYIFRVMPFYVHSSVFRAPGTNPPGYKTLNRLVAKEYNYIYTGKNNNVIKFDIQINQLFQSGINPTPLENTESEANPSQAGTAEDAGQQDVSSNESDPRNQATQGDAPAHKSMEVTKVTTKGGYGAVTVPQKVAQMMMNKILMQGSTGDLMKVNLEVIGDPYWITDSGMGNYISDFYGSEEGPEKGPYALIDGDQCLNYQGTDTYIRIIFATPVEPLLGTTGVGGLYSFPQGKINPYSGIYKVIHCTNSFRDGKFTQVLECTRQPNQAQDFEGGGYEVDKKFFANDVSLADVISTSPNSEAPEYRDDAEDLNLIFGDLGPTGDPLTDEEIAQNNADLGDFMG